MPSVRYVPTGKFSQHSSGTRLERIRFVIIDDDSNAVFCPRSLSTHFGSSERLKRYRYRFPQEEEEEEKEARLTGIECIDSPVASGIPINGRFYTNIRGTRGSCLHTFDTDKGGVGGQVQNEEQNVEQNEEQNEGQDEEQNGGQDEGKNGGKDEGKKGKELLANIHACYHQSQVSKISKFVYWSHGRASCYTPEIALLFKEGTYSMTKFDWQQSPHATVFMCNDYGGVDKLTFGDEAVSGLEYVSLGEPIGNYTAGDTSSFISLIPGSNRADQIFDTLMDKGAREMQRPQWDASSAIMSSSQSTDDGCLMMKSSKKTLWASRHTRQTDLVDSSIGSKTTAGKQLVRTQASGQAEIVVHSTNPPHRTLTWLPSKIPTQMASKVASFFPGGPSKGTKYMVDRVLPLAPMAPVGAPITTITTSLKKSHIEESNKSKKVYERLSRLSRAHPSSEKRNTSTLTDTNPEVIMDRTGNGSPVEFRAKKFGGQTLIGESGEQGRRGFGELVDSMSTPKLITYGKPATCDTIYNVGNKRAHVVNSKLGVSEATHVMGDRKNPPITLEPSASGFGLHGPNITYVLGEGKRDFRASKFDLRGLPHTCVRISNPISTKPAVPPIVPITPPDSPVGEYPDSEDPIFRNCKIQRGFDPIYPSGVTPKMEFENRVGRLENWFAFPMVQVAREYLPEGMKDTDWSWTDNGVSGEFIPGGFAW